MNCSVHTRSRAVYLLSVCTDCIIGYHRWWVSKF